eukprot:scaffold1904_cov184-Amphora_coffeaeformis.AAC.4
MACYSKVSNQFQFVKREIGDVTLSMYRERPKSVRLLLRPRTMKVRDPQLPYVLFSAAIFA